MYNWNRNRATVKYRYIVQHTLFLCSCAELEEKLSFSFSRKFCVEAENVSVVCI